MSARYEVEICRSTIGLLYGLVYRVDDNGRQQIANTARASLGGLSGTREGVVKVATQLARTHRDRHESPDIVRLEL